MSLRLFAAFLLALALRAHAATEDEENFAKGLERTQAMMAHPHVICLVDLEPLNEGKPTNFRYDHYPTVERLQLKGGATYARKKDKSWKKSDDWAETGTKVKPTKAEELDALVSFAEAPINNNIVARDESQGKMVLEVIDRETRPSGGERIFYEMRREHSTGFIYPKFIFDLSPGAAANESFLVGYAGLMYSGAEKVKVNINYSYMFLVDLQPSAEEKAKTSPTPKAKKR